MPDPFHVPAFQEIPSDGTLQSGKRGSLGSWADPGTVVDERTGRNVEPNLRALIRAGDPDAFGLISDEHPRAVYSLGFRLTAN
jgi:hypothetical protein